VITLVATDVIYLSQGDENAFFGWLKNISCVGNTRGVGRNLLIEIAVQNITDRDLRELIALSSRYKIDAKQLATFASTANAHWFRDKKSYWYQSVFE
jgi:hypothetical protein